MNRREFIAGTSSAAMLAAIPAQAVSAIAPPTPIRALKWFAVGHNDEFCYPIRAANMAEAIDKYAHEYGHRKGDYCPECDDVDCKEHLDPTQWDEPHDFIDENASQPKAWDGLTAEPTSVQWLQAGFNVRCEGPICEERSAYWETQECWEHKGKALCGECIYEARRTENVNTAKEQSNGD